MLKWHPLTKLLVAGAALALPYLVWTLPEGEPQPAIPAVRDPGLAVAAQPRRPLVLPALAALGEFAATVERPLFSPGRRLIKPVQAEAAAPQAPADPGPAGPSEPRLRFIGTMGHGGATVAIVAVGDEPRARKLAVGDALDDWQVLSIKRDHLVIGQGSEQRDYAIFLDRRADAGSAGGEAAVTPDPADDGNGNGEGAAPDAAPGGTAPDNPPSKDEGEGQ